MKPLTGIYQIANKINGKRYIGSSVDINKRFIVHRSTLNNRIHHNPHMQNAWNKYGEESFDFVILFYCDTETLLLYEQKCLDELNPEYNISTSAYATGKGLKRSNETCIIWHNVFFTFF